MPARPEGEASDLAVAKARVWIFYREPDERRSIHWTWTSRRRGPTSSPAPANGPWGRVDVPASEREHVCAEWRKSTEAYYGERGCTVTFAKDGCLIENLDCPEEK
jgi:hypothetical protein